MKSFFTKFKTSKLNVQIAIVVILCIFIPTIILSTILISNLRKTVEDEFFQDIEANIIETNNKVEKASEMCNMTTQVILNSSAIKEHIIRTKNNETISTEELIQFYRSDISNMENITLSNPYIYNVRVFAYGDKLTEMMPILYRMDRMKRLSWANDELSSFEWKFDYDDTLFEDDVPKSSRHLMGLISFITDSNQQTIGIMETSVQMTDVFPTLFTAQDTAWECLIDSDGKRYSVKDSRWNSYADKIIEKLDSAAMDDRQFISCTVNGKKLLVAYLPIKTINAKYIYATSLENINVGNTRQYFVIMLMATVMSLLLVVMANWRINTILEKIYKLFGKINDFSEGDTDARISYTGDDELGQFAESINTILDKIQQLMVDNTNRELLAKNSEIKALQNQINVHFIYNVLESIKMMAEVDEEYEISNAVNSLGKLLRYSMHWNSQKVRVEEEIQYIRHYIALTNIRFDNQVKLVIDIPDELMHQEIPKMSLQPLVENSILHGMQNSVKDSMLYITGHADDFRFTLDVRDSGVGMTEEQVAQLVARIHSQFEVSGGDKEGIGLKNVHDRIQMIFGKEYGLNISSEKGMYTTVSVTLPMNRSKERNNENLINSRG